MECMHVNYKIKVIVNSINGPYMKLTTGFCALGAIVWRIACTRAFMRLTHIGNDRYTALQT